MFEGEFEKEVKENKILNYCFEELQEFGWVYGIGYKCLVFSRGIDEPTIVVDTAGYSMIHEGRKGYTIKLSNKELNTFGLVSTGLMHIFEN